MFPAGGPGGETECQYLSSRQYSALNKDFQMDDVFVDPKLLVINKIIFWVNGGGGYRIPRIRVEIN